MIKPVHLLGFLIVFGGLALCILCDVVKRRRARREFEARIRKAAAKGLADAQKRYFAKMGKRNTHGGEPQ